MRQNKLICDKCGIEINDKKYSFFRRMFYDTNSKMYVYYNETINKSYDLCPECDILLKQFFGDTKND
jgi:hypothetical protein